VFKSASLATQGTPNPLGLASTMKAVVILVDGLGSENLRFRPGHAPFLNRSLTRTKSIDCVFPSTTASSITSLLTGLRVGEHGIIGYSVFDRSRGAALHMLTGWGEAFLPSEYQVADSIAQQCNEAGVRAYSVGPAEYENSGFTALNNRGSHYVAAKTIAERFEAAKLLLKRSEASLIYLYVPELDQAAHAYGSESDQWLMKLEELDHEASSFVRSIEHQTAVALTADHGIVNVPAANQIYLDEIDAPELLFVGGDPRASYLYLEEPNTATQLLETYRQHLGDHAYVCQPEELIDKGWFGEKVNEQARALMPDVFVLAKSKCDF